MSTDVILNLTGSLDAELEKARATLREVDDGIKKLFGKENAAEPFGQRNRVNRSQGGQEYKDGHFSDRTRRRRNDDYDEAEPLDKKLRLGSGNAVGKGVKGSPLVIGPRIRPRLSSEDEEHRSKGGGGGRRLQSRVVSSGKEKSREEVLAEQRGDKKGRDRNKRMFGALLGTLQRFKQEETKLKEKEDKRAQIEAKLDEAAKKERDEVRTQRQQLIRERKLRITEIKRLEIKRNRLADLTVWEEKTKYLANFIRTEAKPHIFYMPKKLNPIMECRLEQSKQYVTEVIASKRKLVLEDLEDFEQRSKRYWERRLDGRETRRADPMDEDIEAELKEIMKSDDLAGEEEEMLPTPGRKTSTTGDDADVDPDAEPEGEVEDFKVTVFTSNDHPNNLNNGTLTDPSNHKDIEEGEGEVATKQVIIRRLSLAPEASVDNNIKEKEHLAEENGNDVKMEEDDDAEVTSNENDNDNASRSAQSENDEEPAENDEN